MQSEVVLMKSFGANLNPPLPIVAVGSDDNNACISFSLGTVGLNAALQKADGWYG